MKPPARSLKRRLIGRLIAVQSLVLAFVVGFLFWSGALFEFRSPDSAIETLRDAIERDAAGSLALRETQDIADLRRSVPDLWFVIRDAKGARLAQGEIPPEYADIGAALDRVGQARLGWNIGDPDRPTARMRWVATAAGRVQIMTGSDGQASPHLVFLGLSLILAKLVAPIIAVMAFGAFVATPLVVRSAMAGLGRATDDANAIDVSERARRLSTDDIPAEVSPLVRAVNGALDRLDEGYDRQQRFLADAAHELRTPVAILSVRLAALPESPVKAALAEDASRLAVLADQLLDVQRLGRGAETFAPFDLRALAQRVVMDMAPLAFAAGYEMTFDAPEERVAIRGDRVAIERALANLAQNAIDHGGHSGVIAVRVGAGWVEVADQGEGVPPDLRERAFEAFFRRSQNGRGAGLGLKLVRDVMTLHGGAAAFREAERGACVRLSFPAIADRPAQQRPLAPQRQSV